MTGFKSQRKIVAWIRHKKTQKVLEMSSKELKKINVLGQMKESELSRNKNNWPVPPKAYIWQRFLD